MHIYITRVNMHAKFELATIIIVVCITTYRTTSYKLTYNTDNNHNNTEVWSLKLSRGKKQNDKYMAL